MGLKKTSPVLDPSTFLLSRQSLGALSKPRVLRPTLRSVPSDSPHNFLTFIPIFEAQTTILRASEARSSTALQRHNARIDPPLRAYYGQESRYTPLFWTVLHVFKVGSPTARATPTLRASETFPPLGEGRFGQIAQTPQRAQLPLSRNLLVRRALEPWVGGLALPLLDECPGRFPRSRR